MTAVTTAMDNTLAQILCGNLRETSRLISRIEIGDDSITETLQSLYSRGGHANVIGITGPPGAGKSTLINQLVGIYRKQDLRIAVIAIDPSSPLSGGAILGDRVRMNKHSTDPKVFIRSMASRGQLGGLSKATGDALTVLDAAGFDIIIIETVGVGQNEIDIIRHASTVVVLQTPESGDRIQAAKSGLLEIADIYAINKSDHPGANELAAGIAETLQLRSTAPDWTPLITKTTATKQSEISELISAITAHQQFLRENSEYRQSCEKRRCRYRILEICEQLAQQKLFAQDTRSTQIEKELDAVVSRQQDPYAAAEHISTLPLTTKTS